MKDNVRLMLLEEDKSPTQYVDELSFYISRIRSALIRSSFSLVPNKYQVDGYEILSLCYELDNIRYVYLVSFPVTEDLDLRIIRTPEIVPEIVVSIFTNDTKWIRSQYRYRFDNANKVVRVIKSLQNNIFNIIEKFRDAKDNSAIILDFSKLIGGMRTAEKKQDIIIDSKKLK